MENLKKTITENEEEYKKTIYNMEKKMLQDKVLTFNFIFYYLIMIIVVYK